MRIKTCFLAAAISLAVLVPAAQAQKFSIIHQFDHANGAYPLAPLIADAAGNLYGTTFYGGNSNYYGTVYKLSPTGKETAFVSFDQSNGAGPDFGNLLPDGQGNLYGTSLVGGDLTCQSPPGAGCGTVFKIDRSGKQTVLYAFTQQDGQNPFAGLVRDDSGNLLGTTTTGPGLSQNGTVFEVNPATGQQTIVYAFGDLPDGQYPEAGLIADGQGNFYGTTAFGGAAGGNCFNSGCGTVFELSSNGQGGFSESVLYSFVGGTDGSDPHGLIRDAAGNLYGTTYIGGNFLCYNGAGCGTVFKLSPNGGGSWTETILYRFAGFPGSDGANPWGGLARDASGNLYGTTLWGGGSTACPISGCGTVYRLDPAGHETVLHSFSVTDGAYPYAGLLLNQESKAIYGTAATGGGPGQGIVFKITP
ncbi:MAG: choice-of-anchor tandem repeat GloVer-containing protein [Terriglobales bacterium]